MPDLKRITKGTPVHVIGRMRSQKHTSSDGVEKYFYEIMAQKLEILESEQPES
jgi:single-stranded DNA-binding protein